MALFTRPTSTGARKRSGAGSYTRNALGGLGPKDTERWFSDPRLGPEFQLPDRFFTKDRGAFDRGHIVRREDVAWGDSYEEVQLANGDTFHTTNCSPQVAGFNQAESEDNWGDFERYVAAQVKGTATSCRAVLADDDPSLLGVDDEARRLQIPAAVLKVIVAGSRRTSCLRLLGMTSPTCRLIRCRREWRKHMITVAASRICRHGPLPMSTSRGPAETDAGSVRRIGGMELAHATDLRRGPDVTPVQVDVARTWARLRSAPHSAMTKSGPTWRVARPPTGGSSAVARARSLPSAT